MKCYLIHTGFPSHSIHSLGCSLSSPKYAYVQQQDSSLESPLSWSEQITFTCFCHVLFPDGDGSGQAIHWHLNYSLLSTQSEFSGGTSTYARTKDYQECLYLTLASVPDWDSQTSIFNMCSN